MSLVMAIAGLDGQRAEQDSLEQSLFCSYLLWAGGQGFLFSRDSLFCKWSLIPLAFLGLTILKKGIVRCAPA